MATRRPRLEPVAGEVEEASVGPVARGQEENEEEKRAVDARPVEEVCANEEEEYEGGRGVGRDEEDGEPAMGEAVVSCSTLDRGGIVLMKGITDLRRQNMMVVVKWSVSRLTGASRWSKW